MSKTFNSASIHAMDIPVISMINELTERVHRNAVDHGFHEGEDIKDLNTLGNNMMLMVGELSEAHEAIRKNSLDHPCEKPIDITALEEEFADVIIRVMDTAGELGLNLGRAIVLKHLYNETRPYKHGKKF